MMLLPRALLDAAVLDAALIGLAATIAVAWVARSGAGPQAEAPRRIGLLWSAVAACGIVAALATGNVTGAAIVTLASLVGASLAGWALPRLSSAGALLLASRPLLLAAGVLWGLTLLAELGYPAWAMTLAIGGGLVGIVTIGFNMAGMLVRQATLTHVSWRRPRAPLPIRRCPDAPMISVQVPCYAEPPEIVVDTLDRIAAQGYSRFEVMVCDNNTADEALWRPVQAHCRRLNRRLGFERFRFFHVAPLEGAKAGALNWCMEHMDPAADLVAVLDADYQAEPDFLGRLAGFFDDPAIGYVQTPHDYRAYEDSPYLRACYWEYMPTNRVVYPGINEYDAAFTIGTMCVIRTGAIRAAGGWAEWCLTEDSEISVRLRAIGYQGIYLPQTFGRGLIPETFEDYRKQRFRWVAGPVQQLRRYWRHYLPRPFGIRSGINGWSKLLEFQRSAAPVLDLATSLVGLAAAAAMLVLSSADLVPDLVLPPIAWPLLLIGMVTTAVGTWARYRRSGCVRLGDMLLGELARSSLLLVQMSAAIAGLSPRPQAWRRTPKFAAAGSWHRAFTATAAETIAGLVTIALSLLFLLGSGPAGAHLAILGTIGSFAVGARFLSAPAMALLGERDLARRERERSAGEEQYAATAHKRALWKAA